MCIKSNSCRFTVIPACPESVFKKDSRLASLAGMTNDCCLYTDTIYSQNLFAVIPEMNSGQALNSFQDLYKRNMLKIRDSEINSE